MTKKKSKKKKIIIIIAIVLVFILWISSCTNKMKKAMEELNSKITEIDEVTKRDLVDSVGATGNIASINSRDITVDITSAEVRKINVKVGDVVKKGTVLASFNMANSYQDLIEAQNDLNSTREVNDITLEDARRKLENLKNQYNNELKDLKDAISDAKELYNNAKKDNLIEPSKDKQEDVDKAYSALETAKDTYYDTKAELEDKIKSTENEIKKLELSSSTSTQESQIRTYKTRVNNGTLRAPIDGTITNIYYEESDNYSPGTTFLTIQDCSSYVIKAEVNEYDISRIKIGQKVVIKTDATGDEEINGTVKEISPVATKVAEGVTKSNKTYTVKVSIDDKNDKIKLDMSSNISIIIDEHKGVLTVPYNAVYTDQDGKYYVIKVDGEEHKNVYVNVIMESSYYTEISGDDIYEGMKVYIENKDDENPLLTIMQNGGF